MNQKQADIRFLSSVLLAVTFEIALRNQWSDVRIVSGALKNQLLRNTQGGLKKPRISASCAFFVPKALSLRLQIT